jgi:hypothetical protein
MPISESLALTRGRPNEFPAPGIRLIPQRFDQDRTATLDASRSPPGDLANTSTARRRAWPDPRPRGTSTRRGHWPEPVRQWSRPRSHWRPLQERPQQVDWVEERRKVVVIQAALAPLEGSTNTNLTASTDIANKPPTAFMGLVPRPNEMPGDQRSALLPTIGPRSFQYRDR